MRRLQEAQRLSEEAPDDVGLLVYQPNVYTPDAGYALSVITGRVSIALLHQRLWRGTPDAVCAFFLVVALL